MISGKGPKGPWRRTRVGATIRGMLKPAPARIGPVDPDLQRSLEPVLDCAEPIYGPVRSVPVGSEPQVSWLLPSTGRLFVVEEFRRPGASLEELCREGHVRCFDLSEFVRVRCSTLRDGWVVLESRVSPLESRYFRVPRHQAKGLARLLIALGVGGRLGRRPRHRGASSGTIDLTPGGPIDSPVGRPGRLRRRRRAPR